MVLARLSRSKQAYICRSSIARSARFSCAFQFGRKYPQPQLTKNATRKGILPNLTDTNGLQFHSPEKLQLRIQPSTVGAVPVVVTDDRHDFLQLVQAILYRNEPATIAESVGAFMVSGYNNWDRIERQRQRWLMQNPEVDRRLWQLELRRLVQDKTTYQDRFILAYAGDYSGVSAELIGIPAAEWQHKSLEIRIEHELAHYFTMRCFSAFNTHLHDELLADYVGLSAAFGNFKAAHFLRFLGLENRSSFREGGRLTHYVDQRWIEEPVLFSTLARTVTQAAAALEKFDHTTTLNNRAAILAGLATTSLATLAAPDGHVYLERQADYFSQQASRRGSVTTALTS